MSEALVPGERIPVKFVDALKGVMAANAIGQQVIDQVIDEAFEKVEPPTINDMAVRWATAHGYPVGHAQHEDIVMAYEDGYHQDIDDEMKFREQIVKMVRGY